MKNKEGKKDMTLKAAVQLAAPHTWPASVLPVLLGGGLYCGESGSLSPWILLCTLVTAVFLQSAVNTLNDYRDFVSGLDNEENCDDPTDAALVYECGSPKAALALGLGFLLMAAVFGAVLVINCGASMLIYGGLGLAAILLYTLPGVSFSDLPLGELLSGFTMGGVLSCASYHAQVGRISAETALLCLPAVITIGCIMLVNNTADMEKDRQGGRKTFPVCAGRLAAQNVLRISIALAAAGVFALVIICFRGGAAALPVMAVMLAIDPGVRSLYSRPVLPENRTPAMRGVLSAHILIISCYTAAAFLSGVSI